MREIARIKPIERRTWRTWPEWLNFMEKIDAHTLDHHGLVLKAYEGAEGEIENVGWWTQAITAAYEQHIDRRIPGHRSEGMFQNKSKQIHQSWFARRDGSMVEIASCDKDMLGIVDGEVRVSGTENRVAWCMKARDGPSLVKTCESKANGSPSTIATEMGFESLKINYSSKEQ